MLLESAVTQAVGMDNYIVGIFPQPALALQKYLSKSITVILRKVLVSAII